MKEAGTPTVAVREELLRSEAASGASSPLSGSGEIPDDPQAKYDRDSLPADPSDADSGSSYEPSESPSAMIAAMMSTMEIPKPWMGLLMGGIRLSVGSTQTRTNP